MDRREWLASRRKGITATDIAAIAGLSPWKTAFDVFLEKRGLIQETELNPEQEWGLLQETSLFGWYERHFGVTLFEPGLVVHPEASWIMATPDRQRYDDRRLVEGKTSQVAATWGDPGTEEIPEYYYLQCQWQMLTTQTDKVDLVVSLRGAPPVVYQVRAHSQLQGTLKEMAWQFWESTLRGVQPPLHYRHPRTLDLLRSLYPPDSSAVFIADAEVESLAREVEDLREQEAGLKMRASETKARLIERMGACRTARLPGGGTVTRRVVNRKAYTCEVAATSYEILKIDIGDR